MFCIGSCFLSHVMWTIQVCTSLYKWQVAEGGMEHSVQQRSQCTVNHVCTSQAEVNTRCECWTQFVGKWSKGLKKGGTNVGCRTRLWSTNPGPLWANVLQVYSGHGALHCTALHCTALHCTALHCTGRGEARCGAAVGQVVGYKWPIAD